MKKVAFYTLGCKVNQYESNAMEEQFINNGYEVVKNTEIADIYVVNTCVVTNVAQRKSRQMISRVKKLNENAIIIVCGCYAQVSRDELEKIDYINLIIDSSEKNRIIEILNEFIEKNKKTNKPEIEETNFLDFGCVTYTEKNRAVVKVQDGCNMFCTYCIIPYARGRIRSRSIESVKNEITEIAKKGYKEVVITGIHVASYGKDLDEKREKNNLDKIRLIDLLEEINKVDGIERIRLSSIEPTIITDEFLDRLIKLDKICDHFHLSLQSGCNETLKRMNRKYDTNEFLNCVNMLRNKFENVGLTADVIVGFPGETEEEFNKTYEFLKSIDFYKMHIFKYSIRKGTPAATMENQVDGNIKEERSKKLIELSKELANKHNKKYVGKNIEVLFEEYDEGFYKGHTTNYIEVKVKDDENMKEKYVDKIIMVKILSNDAETSELIAEAIL